MLGFRCFDPLYGKTNLNIFQAEMLRFPEVQRLRNIRMCNINSMLIAGASQISRFEHSLGVVRLAKEWSAAAHASAEEEMIICAAAMLHDIKTGPFGHSLEYTFADNPNSAPFDHQRLDRNVHDTFFQKTDFNVSYLGSHFVAQEKLRAIWSAVSKAIAGEGSFGPLISNDIDLDNIDNVIRLAYHIGIATNADGQVAIELARDLRIVDGKLAISSASIPRIERWQFLRHQLYRFLLHDWAEFSAKGMLTKAIEIAASNAIVGVDSWILTDDDFVKLLISSSIGEHQSIADLVKRVMLGNLYVPVAIVRSSTTVSYKKLADPQTKRQIEQHIGAVAKCKCVFHVILDKGKLDRKVSLFIRDFNETISFGENSDEILIGIFAARALGEGLSSAVIEQFHCEIRPYLLDFHTLHDPLEDQFQAVSEQLHLL